MNRLHNDVVRYLSYSTQMILGSTKQNTKLKKNITYISVCIHSVPFLGKRLLWEYKYSKKVSVIPGYDPAPRKYMHFV